MALVVFLRGVNVGGHRTFRPSVLARELSSYGVTSVGAAGTFIVRKPGSRAELERAFSRKLPFPAELMICDGRDLIRVATEDPFAGEPSPPDVVRFVSILARAGRLPAPLPITLPAEGEWLVRVFARQKRFLFGLYRRHMKTIGCLGQLDRLFGGRATTRSWNTVMAIVKALQVDG